MKCPYCGSEARWVENKEIYGKNYGNSFMCYLCKPCDAYVGCHQNTKRPLGSMANAELRNLRKKAHSIIDPYWKDGMYERKEMYGKLSKALGREVHVAESNEDQCKEIIEKANSILIGGK